MISVISPRLTHATSSMVDANTNHMISVSDKTADVGVGRRGATTSWAAARMAPEEGPMELRNVNAVVTGGASGLGRATAERLVAAGGLVGGVEWSVSAGTD